MRSDDWFPTQDEFKAVSRMTRDDRVRMSTAAVAHDDELRDLVAERIAFRLVQNTDAYRHRNFSVLDQHQPLPFERHWNYKNVSGVTFKRTEAAPARVWVKRALLAGFTVFCSHRKHGGGSGRGLNDGIYSDDELWLYRELRARGIKGWHHD